MKKILLIAMTTLSFAGCAQTTHQGAISNPAMALFSITVIGVPTYFLMRDE